MTKAIMPDASAVHLCYHAKAEAPYAAPLAAMTSRFRLLAKPRDGDM
jgi:hypothetical protein